ncbi:MAG: VLRF1 family aeRF1-type release factor [Candidatus Acidiferrales bacterium]
MANASVLHAVSELQNPLHSRYTGAPHCVVAVDRTRARFFRYEFGRLTPIEIREFEIDQSQWKMKDHAHMARRDTKMPHGAERDVFKKRMDAQYQHLCSETAAEIRAVCQKYKLAGIILVGSARLIDPIAEALPTELKPNVMMIPKDLARFSISELKDHIAPAIAQWEQTQQGIVVADLLSAESGAVIGIDETLAQLQDGSVRNLVVAEKLDARLSQCVKCSLTSRSADPVCMICGSSRQHVQLLDVLPELASTQKAEIERVSGSAAETLTAAGGIGAWLRNRR